MSTQVIPPGAFLKVDVKPGEYRAIQEFLYDESGIDLGEGKQDMVTGRLRKRLRHHNILSYGEYFELAMNPANPDERQEMLNLLTTNETYFFRENNHYEYLVDTVLPEHPRGQMFRVWSAASSSGEEAYGLAMELAANLGSSPWSVFGSDISTKVVEKARTGHYAMQRIDGIPKDYLQRFCLKGKGDQEGTLLISPKLRERVDFQAINLKENLPDIGIFDVVFLRNILIYFDMETKAAIVERVLTKLKKGGYLMIGHSESLKNCDVDLGLEFLGPTLYQKM